jgi:hypothetical protein
MVAVDAVTFIVVVVLCNVITLCTFTDGAMNGDCIICAVNKTFKASQTKSGAVIKPFLIYKRLKCKFQYILFSA